MLVSLFRIVYVIICQGYTVSAHLGNVLAMHKLGHMHQRALGVPSRSCAAAVQYFRSVVRLLLKTLILLSKFTLIDCVIHTVFRLSVVNGR